MIRLCKGYPVHNNQTRTGSLFVRPRWKNRINKSIKTCKAPRYSWTKTRKFWRSSLKTWLSVRCVHSDPEPQMQNCLLYQPMWWSDFTTLKENPKADLSNGFYCGKFIFSAQLMKLNHFFFCFNPALSTNQRRSEDAPSYFLCPSDYQSLDA